MSANKQITVKIKNVYGNEMIYPVCEDAHIFCALLQQKTFTRDDIKLIKDLGYTVNVEVKTTQL